MTTTEETSTAIACPPSAVVDQIVPWPDVQPGELVLWDGELCPVERNLAYAGDPRIRLITLAGGAVEMIPVGTYAAVRRYTEGRSDDDALILAALAEAAADRTERAAAYCQMCGEMEGERCMDCLDHLDRASQYRDLRDRLEAGR